MKALIYTEPGALEYRETAEPDREPDDVLVKVDAVGICGSDMHAYLGHDERRAAPLILGHEAAGTVMNGNLADARVVINPLVTCGECGPCAAGRENLCANRQIISMAPRQGAFAEYVAIPERNLIPIPAGLGPVKAALAEPIATGWRAVRKAREAADTPLNECRSLVFGSGAVGLAAALSLHEAGCPGVTVAETNPKRRATAEAAGLFTVIDPLVEGALEESAMDVVIDCVGAKPTRRAACAAIRPGGVIVHVGLADGADGIDVRKLTLQEVTLIGSYTYTMDDFRAALAAMASGALGPLDWFEQRPLAAGADAFADLLGGRTAAAKIILRPSA